MGVVLTKYEKEQRLIVLNRDGYSCVVCGIRAESMGHIAPQRKWIIEKYGFKTIHHNSNMRCTCNIHNATVQINPNSEAQIKEQIEIIYRSICDEKFS